MVNCKKCQRNYPLNLVCFDQKCGLEQNLNLICCMCHTPLIHQTVSINMFLDIALITTQNWIDSKDETNILIDELEKLIEKLLEKKSRIDSFLKYYDSNKHRYIKLLNMIQEFKDQINESQSDNEEGFEETFKLIKSHFNYSINNQNQPIQLKAEQSYDTIKMNISEKLNRFTKNYLQVAEIRDEDLKAFMGKSCKLTKQHQIKNSYQTQILNGFQNTNGTKNIQSNQKQYINENKNVNFDESNQKDKNKNFERSQINKVIQNNSENINMSIDNNKTEFIESNRNQNSYQSQADNQYDISNNNNNNNQVKNIQQKQSTNLKNQQNKKLSVLQKNTNTYQNKEILDYDELDRQNLVDVRFKFIPNFIEERKKNDYKKLDFEENLKNMSAVNQNITDQISSNYQNNNIQKAEQMEIEQLGSSLQSNRIGIEEESQKKQQQLKQESQSKHQEENTNLQNFKQKNNIQDDQVEIKRDSLQFFEDNLKKLNSSFEKNEFIENDESLLKQSQEQAKQDDKKMRTRSGSQTNSMSHISQQKQNISQENQKQPKKETRQQMDNKQKEIDSNQSFSEKFKQINNQSNLIKVDKGMMQRSSYQKQSHTESEINSHSKYENEDQENSSNINVLIQYSEDKDQDDIDNQKLDSSPSEKKQKYIKKYDRKRQDYLKTLTEEQIDELILDYNHLKNWKEVEKKWGISKYHIIKYFKEKNYILAPHPDSPEHVSQ